MKTAHDFTAGVLAKTAGLSMSEAGALLAALAGTAGLGYGVHRSLKANEPKGVPAWFQEPAMQDEVARLKQQLAERRTTGSWL